MLFLLRNFACLGNQDFLVLMQIFKLFKLVSVLFRNLVYLLTLYSIINLQIQPAFADATTIVLPLHTTLPGSIDAQTAATTSVPNVATSQPITDNPSAILSQSNSSQPETTPPLQNQPSGNAPKLKGRVIVPANPYGGVNNSSTPFAPEGTVRRGLPAPLDAVFPSTEYAGVASQLQIGIPDQDPMFPLEKAIYKACPLGQK